MTAQVAADLRAAAEVLRRDGWTQGTDLDVDGSRCAISAIGAACETDYRRDNAAYRFFLGYVHTAYLVPDVTTFNDDVAKSADEVIAALCAAADAAEADQ